MGHVILDRYESYVHSHRDTLIYTETCIYKPPPPRKLAVLFPLPLEQKVKEGFRVQRLLLGYGSSQDFLESIGGFDEEQSVDLESFFSLNISLLKSKSPASPYASRLLSFNNLQSDLSIEIDLLSSPGYTI